MKYLDITKNIYKTDYITFKHKRKKYMEAI